MVKKQVDVELIYYRLQEIDKKLESLTFVNNRLNEHDKDIVTVKTQLSNFNIFQTVLTFIGSAIASYLGLSKR